VTYCQSYQIWKYVRNGTTPPQAQQPPPPPGLWHPAPQAYSYNAMLMLLNAFAGTHITNSTGSKVCAAVVW
jgi:hypothetical protein